MTYMETFLEYHKVEHAVAGIRILSCL